jgi:hypothetical protein
MPGHNDVSLGASRVPPPTFVQAASDATNRITSALKSGFMVHILSIVQVL